MSNNDNNENKVEEAEEIEEKTDVSETPEVYEIPLEELTDEELVARGEELYSKLNGMDEPYRPNNRMPPSYPYRGNELPEDFNLGSFGDDVLDDDDEEIEEVPDIKKSKTKKIDANTLPKIEERLEKAKNRSLYGR